MIKALIYGASGKMGNVVKEICDSDNGISAVCGIDGRNIENGLKIYHSFEDMREAIDVIIDFSSPSALTDIMQYATQNKVPVVLAATGYTDEQNAYIKECAASTAIFKTANFSLGVNLLCRLAKKAAETLGESFDVEIIEKHHNKKVDAPSGTALMLANSINSGLEQKREYLYGREGKVGKRGNEIGMHAVRGGTIVGEHEVLFCGEDEIVTLAHSARSKRVFAAGAVKAAKWLYGKANGLYGMDDLLKDILQ